MARAAGSIFDRHANTDDDADDDDDDDGGGWGAVLLKGAEALVACNGMLLPTPISLSSSS